MLSEDMQLLFYSGERIVAHGPLVCYSSIRLWCLGKAVLCYLGFSLVTSLVKPRLLFSNL